MFWIKVHRHNILMGCVKEPHLDHGDLSKLNGTEMQTYLLTYLRKLWSLCTNLCRIGLGSVNGVVKHVIGVGWCRSPWLPPDISVNLGRDINECCHWCFVRLVMSIAGELAGRNSPDDEICRCSPSTPRTSNSFVTICKDSSRLNVCQHL